MTGLRGAQLTRLRGCYLATGAGEDRVSVTPIKGPTRYTRADIELLAQVDVVLPETLSGPATAAPLERELGHYRKLDSFAWPPSPTGIFAF